MRGDVLLTTHQARIAQLALEGRLPAMYTTRPFVQAGGLISYGASFAEMFVAPRPTWTAS